VHVAHLAAAAQVRHDLSLDRVLLVVAADPWQKRHQVAAPAEDRYAMVAAAVADVDGLEASRLELDRGGPSYTVDTLHALAAPSRDLFLAVGADVAAHLASWERVDEVRALVTLVVVDRGDRPGDSSVLDGWKVERVAIPRIDVSSTDLRRRVAAGEPIDFLVPPGAVRVLRERRLYT
jgi:nicotinate-nucleotide adenylyltransferase